MQRFLPSEWEEKWRKEKETKRRNLEMGGEGVERDEHELRRIVAFNDARMGLRGGGGDREKPQDWMRETVQELQVPSEGLDHKVCSYHSATHPQTFFIVLKNFCTSSLLTDLTVSTDSGSTFSVHSLVLAAVSSLIRDKLMEERGSPSLQRCSWSINLGPEVHHTGLEAVVQFAYTGAMPMLNEDSVSEVKAAAKALGAPRVMLLCKAIEELKEVGGRHKIKEISMCAQEQIQTTLQTIRQMWMDGVGCDVTFKVDGMSLHAHKVILAANSEYFRAMFTCGMQESNQTCISLPFLLAHELQTLIGCSYSGSLALSWDCVFEMTSTALRLQFEPALSLCQKFLRNEMDSDSCLDVASFAEAYGVTALLEEANDFVLRNFLEVSTHKKFQDLPAEKLQGLLMCDGLCAPSELTVFRAVVFWIQADQEHRLSQARSLMAAVRFPLMTFREFREVRAINLRMECVQGEDETEVDLYSSALKEFGFSLPNTQDPWRVRRPKDALVLIGGDQLSVDTGQRVPSRELWFANSIRSGTGLVKNVEWRKLSEIPDKPKFRHGVAVLEGQLYVLGGCEFYSKEDTMKSVYRYNPETGNWKRIADMQEFRSNFAVVVKDERLYAIGGDKELNSNSDTVEMYSPDADSWSFVQPLGQALSGHAVTVVDGKIFISGGFDSKYVCLVSMISYHPKTGTTKLAAMNHDRAQHCMEALRGHIYVAGGVCNLRSFYTDQRICEVYDPVTDSWNDFAPLPMAHVGAASAVLEERIYILGGYCQDDYSESGLVHRYNPSTGRWENLSKMPGAISDIQACVLHLPQHLRTATALG